MASRRTLHVPKLLQEIMESDNVVSRVLSEPVIDMHAAKTAIKQKRALIRAADAIYMTLRGDKVQ